jgi:Grap2 and cyclin-D-interacting, N-terminal
MSKACATRCKIIEETGRAVFLGMRAVLEEFASIIREGREVQTHVVGALLEQCLAIKKIPPSNSAAINKGVLLSMTLIKDCRQELDSFTVEQKSDANVDSDSKHASTATTIDVHAHEFEEAFFDDFGMDSSVTAAEFKNIELAVTLSKVAFQVLRKLCTFITFTTRVDTQVTHIAWLEHAGKLATALQRAMDDAGASMYSPQDPSLVAASLIQLTDQISELMQHMSSHAKFAASFKASVSKKLKASDQERTVPTEEELENACQSWRNQVQTMLTESQHAAEALAKAAS